MTYHSLADGILDKGSHDDYEKEEARRAKPKLPGQKRLFILEVAEAHCGETLHPQLAEELQSLRQQFASTL